MRVLFASGAMAVRTGLGRLMRDAILLMLRQVSTPTLSFFLGRPMLDTLR